MEATTKILTTAITTRNAADLENAELHLVQMTILAVPSGDDTIGS